MTTPSATLDRAPAAAQSLASGQAGAALLPIEQAIAGTTGWQPAHRHLAQIAAAPIDIADHTGLFYGAPAVSFLLHAATADGCPRYRNAAATLDRHIADLAHRRVAHARTRVRRGQPAVFDEYDLFYGLGGVAALLLRRNAGSEVLADILRYLVELATVPYRCEGARLPGWWVGHDPDPLRPTPGGHANLGMAHGAAGVLALLAIATRENAVVDGQLEAIEHLTGWFDTWRQDSPRGPWWPQWLNQEELATGRLQQPGPQRPSWCYGTPGIARALQLAALATGDRARQAQAEAALAACLADPAQLAHLEEGGLCHGWAGLFQTVWRAAGDSGNPTLTRALPHLANQLHRTNTATGAGLLTGRAGAALARHTAHHDRVHSGWDSCLLIN